MIRNFILVFIAVLLVSCEKDNEELTVGEDPFIISFKFEKEHNPDLESDLVLEQSDKVFSAEFKGTNIPLIATFEIFGDKLLIDDIEQESGISANNFSKPVVYTISKKGKYSINYTVQLIQTKQVPIIRIVTESSEEITKEDYVKCTIEQIGGDDYDSFTAEGKIRGRGNSSWYFHPKKPYQLKLSDKTSVLGLAAEKKWIFLAEHSDKTLLRNMLAFEMGRLSELDYTPAGEFAEVYIDDEYVGLYNVCQKVEEGDNRVDLKDTGYLCEIDQLDRIDHDDTYFQTETYYINIKDPDVEYETEKFDIVKNRINEFEKVLLSDDFLDEGTGYKEYVDLVSFADWFLINEITRNPDAKSWSSIFFTYVPDEKIKMGPIWDFDLSLGNANYDGHENATGFWVIHNTWISRMYRDPEFQNLVRERFDYFNSNKSNLMSYLDYNYSYISPSHERNNQKWDLLGNWVWPNIVVYNSFNEELEYLQNYLDTRMEWLDSNLN